MVNIESVCYVSSEVIFSIPAYPVVSGIQWFFGTDKLSYKMAQERIHVQCDRCSDRQFEPYGRVVVEGIGEITLQGKLLRQQHPRHHIDRAVHLGAVLVIDSHELVLISHAVSMMNSPLHAGMQYHLK